MKIDFQHLQHAHCESGATSNLFSHHGIALSEAMAFGIGAGIYFSHPFFIKAIGAPITSYRYFPGVVFKQTAKMLGADVEFKTFGSNKVKATKALDNLLNQGVPVGLITDIYYLNYLPEMFRFHFNAHNLIVYGKEKDRYLISDSILEIPVAVDGESLARARFGTGFMSTRGKMYHIKNLSAQVDLAPAIKEGIRLASNRILNKPLPWAGIKGMHLLAERIKKYPKKLTPEQNTLYLSNIVRMQEVVGTGGSGYRFLYADFLKEAGEYLQSDALIKMASRMKDIAFRWREFASKAARLAKSRSDSNFSHQDLGALLHQIADLEKAFFTELKSIVK